MRVRFVISMLASLALVACSDSSFLGGAQTKSPKDKKNLTDGEPVPSDDFANDNDAADGGDPTTPNEGYDVNSSTELDGRNDSAERNETDFDTFGCKFPDDVKQAAQGLNLTSFSLGWGGTAKTPSVTEITLTNLDVNDCEWFAKNRGAAADGFMLVYNDGDQSFAEPFGGGFGLFFGKGGRDNSGAGQCRTAATTLTQQINGRKIKGKVECSKLPQPSPSPLASGND